jgi:tetratricopeptide (TPR) repeat protein
VASEHSSLLATALALHQQGQIGQARQQYAAILAAEPGHAAGHHYLGLLEHQSGNYGPALQHLQTAVQSDQAQAFYWVNLGNLLKDLQRPQEAEEAYQHALAQEPNDTLALYNLGHLYQLYARWSDAAAGYGQALSVPSLSAAIMPRRWRILAAPSAKPAFQTWRNKRLRRRFGSNPISPRLTPTSAMPISIRASWI